MAEQYCVPLVTSGFCVQPSGSVPIRSVQLYSDLAGAFIMALFGPHSAVHPLRTGRIGLLQLHAASMTVELAASWYILRIAAYNELSSAHAAVPVKPERTPISQCGCRALMPAGRAGPNKLAVAKCITAGVLLLRNPTTQHRGSGSCVGNGGSCQRALDAINADAPCRACRPTPRRLSVYAPCGPTVSRVRLHLRSRPAELTLLSMNPIASKKPTDA